MSNMETRLYFCIKRSPTLSPPLFQTTKARLQIYYIGNLLRSYTLNILRWKSLTKLVFKLTLESVTELNFKYTTLTIRYIATLQIVHRHPVPKLNKLQLYAFCTCSLLVIGISVLQLPFHSMWVLTLVLRHTGASFCT